MSERVDHERVVDELARRAAERAAGAAKRPLVSERPSVEDIAREFAVKWNYRYVNTGQQDWIEGKPGWAPDDDTLDLAAEVAALLRKERDGAR